MPVRHPHEVGLRLAGDPPAYETYASKPESVWHLAQDAWFAQFSEAKRMLPPPGIAGSAESKARAKAWRSAIKQHAKAKRMSLALAGDVDANASLDGEAGYAFEHARKRAAPEDGAAMHPRPRGSAPSEHPIWDSECGVWVNANGERRPEATRNQRRVQQRNASEEQMRKHKMKWQLYDSGGRHYNRTHPEAAAIASAHARKIEEDDRRWKAHLQAVNAGRPGEFSPSSATSVIKDCSHATAPPPVPAHLRPPFSPPERPTDLPQIALQHRVGDRVEWFNNYHRDGASSNPVFGWQPGTVVCTYNVCVLARAADHPNPYRTPGADYTAEVCRQFHFDGCRSCTLESPYAVRLDRSDGPAEFRGYFGAVQSAPALCVRSLAG